MALKLPKVKLPRLNEVKSAFKSEATSFAALTSDQRNAYNQAIYAWQAPLYVNKRKPFWWYIVAAAVVIGLVVYGLVSGAWTLSMAIVLFVGVYYYFSNQEVPVVDIVLSEAGVRVGGKVYPYSMFRTFWVDYHPPVIQELHLIPNNNYKYELTLNLQGQNPAPIKAVLQQFMPEWADRQKTVTESLVHLIGL